MLGPGTDLVISLVAVLVLLLSLVMADLQSKKKELEKLADLKKLEKRKELLEKVRRNQLEIIKGIASIYSSEAITDKDSLKYNIVINKNTKEQDSITVYNDVSLQRISFGENILFLSGQSFLQKKGKSAISKVANVFKRKLDSIKEIGIQGHADLTGNAAFNLRLASQRAIAVYEFLQIQVKIDPAVSLMSASSYGHYYPVRRDIDEDFDRKLLGEANSNSTLQAKNRRIEILLNYKGDFIAGK